MNRGFDFRIRRVRECLRAYWHSMKAGHLELRPVFVLATARSGSRLLISYLESLPRVFFRSELLNPSMIYGLDRRDPPAPPARALAHLNRMLRLGGKSICGCKLLHQHMIWHGLRPRDLAGFFPAARFLVLYRRSLGEQALSTCLARATGEYVRTSPDSLPQIEMTPGFLRWFGDGIRRFYDSLASDPALEGKSFWLAYEDLDERAQEIFSRGIMPFLGLPESRISTSLRRQREKEPSCYIRNYAEVRPWFEEGRDRLDYPAGISGREALHVC